MPAIEGKGTSSWNLAKLSYLSKEIQFLGTPNKMYSRGLYFWVAFGEVAATDKLSSN